MATEDAASIGSGAATGAAVGSVAGPIGTAVGAVAGAAFSYFGGRSAKKKAKRSARQRAALLRKEADVERERSRRLVSAQRAAYGAAGVDPTAGSAGLVQSQAFMDSIRDQERILAGAQIDYKNQKNLASSYQTQGIASGVAMLFNRDTFDAAARLAGRR